MRKKPAMWWGPVRSETRFQLLEEGHAPSQPIDSGTEALLAESIRFFNLDHPAVLRAGWETLRLHQAELTQIRATIHDALFEYLLLAMSDANLMSWVPPSKMRELYPKQLPKKLNHATRARLLILALLDPQWRSGGGRPDIRPLRWERIVSALSELRQVASRSSFEAQLRAAFGEAIVTPPGGRLGLHLLDSNMTETGLAEKIYSQGGAVVTRLQIAPWGLGFPLKPIVGRDDTRFTFHLDVKAAAEEVLNAALPWTSVQEETFPDPFSNWFQALDVMEQWLSAIVDTTLGAAAGVPWGLGLTATLRAYVTDVLISLFMLSMPVSRLHDQLASPESRPLYKFRYPFGPSKGPYKSLYDSLLAVGLWECLSGEVAAHPNLGNAGFIVEAKGDPLLTRLSRWLPASRGGREGEALGVVSFWGDSGKSLEHGELSQYVRKEVKQPCFMWVSMGEDGGKGQRGQDRDGSDGLRWEAAERVPLTTVFTSWPTHPRFFRHVKEEARKRPKLNSGEDHAGTLFSQLSLFVANSIATHLALALNLTDKATPTPQAIQALPAGSGSLMWGGCNSPHAEHRFGSVFDIDHCHPNPRWPLRSVCKPKREMYQTAREAPPRPGPQVSRVQYVYYPRDKIKVMIRDALTSFANGTKLAIIDRDFLAGTPIVCTEPLVENLIGHVALLLAAPYKMIMGSPIMHLRAIHVIHESLDVREVKKAVPAFLAPEFYFLPDDHYDHWHVVFYALEGSSGDPRPIRPARTRPPVRGEGKIATPKIIKALCEFWNGLGLPLEAFTKYLSDLNFEKASSPNVGQPEAERVALLKVLPAVKEKKPSQGVGKPGLKEPSLEERGKPDVNQTLSQLVNLLRDPRFVECNAEILKPSKRLREIGVLCPDPGADASEGNERLQSRIEQNELMSVDPTASRPQF